MEEPEGFLREGEEGGVGVALTAGGGRRATGERECFNKRRRIERGAGEGRLQQVLALHCDVAVRSGAHEAKHIRTFTCAREAPEGYCVFGECVKWGPGTEVRCVGTSCLARAPGKCCLRSTFNGCVRALN